MAVKAKLKLVFRIWWKIALMSTQSQLLTGWSGIGFFLGKVIRILLFFTFLTAIISSSKNLAGYTQDQVIWFFLVFTLIDSLTQFIFRGVYQFRALVLTGNYDLDLLKPLPSFFRPLFGWADFQDLVILFPLLLTLSWFMVTHLAPQPLYIFLFIFQIGVSLLIALAIHLIIVSLGILTTEIDHLVMVYRDLTALARFPTDIYLPGIQTLLTFVVPVVIMITIPAKSLLGQLSPQIIIGIFLFSCCFTLLAFRFWYYALRRYSSASS